MFQTIKKMSILFCMCMFLSSCGSESEPLGVKVEEPVIMGITTFDDYALALQLYEGEYQSDLN